MLGEGGEGDNEEISSHKVDGLVSSNSEFDLH